MRKSKYPLIKCKWKNNWMWIYGAFEIWDKTDNEPYYNITTNIIAARTNKKFKTFAKAIDYIDNYYYN